MTVWTKCPGCALIFDPARFGPHPLHARLERDSEYLDKLAERARAGETLMYAPLKGAGKVRKVRKNRGDKR